MLEFSIAAPTDHNGQGMPPGKNRYASAAFAMFLGLCITAVPSSAQQNEIEVTDFGAGFVVSLGGKFYDNLWTATGAKPPARRNPAFPPIPEINDADTWRCVSCHGWDYKGIKGERAVLGRHQAFKDLRHLVEKDPKSIADKIRSSHPPIPAQAIPDFVIEVLAVFISVGMYDRDAIMDDTNHISGDRDRGRDIFEGACMNCHRPDGRMPLRGEKGDRSSLGWIARNRPEQTVHKILNGVPGAEMLAVGFLEPHQIVNLLSYLQALDPDEK
jgi:thiosulfate dehydrogenase